MESGVGYLCCVGEEVMLVQQQGSAESSLWKWLLEMCYFCMESWDRAADHKGSRTDWPPWKVAGSRGGRVLSVGNVSPCAPSCSVS